MYARALRLRYLRVTPMFSVLLFEGMIGLAVLLTMAELVTWWGILLIPAAVAVMVKINDVAAGVVCGAPLQLAAASGTVDRDTGVGGGSAGGAGVSGAGAGGAGGSGAGGRLGRHAASADAGQIWHFGALLRRWRGDATGGLACGPSDGAVCSASESSCATAPETGAPEGHQLANSAEAGPARGGAGTVYRSQSARPTPGPKPEPNGDAAAPPAPRKRVPGPQRGKSMINGRPARPVHDDENGARFRGGLNQGRFD